MSRGDEVREGPDPSDLNGPGVIQHLRCTHGEEEAKTEKDLPTTTSKSKLI